MGMDIFIKKKERKETKYTATQVRADALTCFATLRKVGDSL